MALKNALLTILVSGSLMAAEIPPPAAEALASRTRGLPETHASLAPLNCLAEVMRLPRKTIGA